MARENLKKVSYASREGKLNAREVDDIGESIGEGKSRHHHLKKITGSAKNGQPARYATFHEKAPGAGGLSSSCPREEELAKRSVKIFFPGRR